MASKRELELYLQKTVFIKTSFGYVYSGRVLQVSDVSITLFDKFKENVTLNHENIALIKEKNSGGGRK